MASVVVFGAESVDSLYTIEVLGTPDVQDVSIDGKNGYQCIVRGFVIL